MKALLALIVGTFVGMQGIVLLPVLIAASIDGFGLQEQTGGYLATVQLGVAAVSAFLISLRINRLSRRRLYVLGAGIACAGNVLSFIAILSKNVPLLFLSRVIEGSGEGLLIATVNAIAAATSRPLRSFALMNGGLALAASGAYLLSGRLLEQQGPRGLYAMMALFAAVAALCVPLLPAETVKVSTIEGRFGFPVRAWYGQLAYTLFMLVTGGTWAFCFRLGVKDVGLSAAQVGRVISIAAALMIVGPYLANLLGKRFGWILPFTVAAFAYFMVAWSFASVTSTWAFALTCVSHTIVSSFAMTIGQALLAELDPSGRAPAASQAFNSLGNSLGPSLVAMALPYFQNYDAIAWLAAVVLSCALAIYIVIIRSIQPSHAVAGPRTDLR